MKKNDRYPELQTNPATNFYIVCNDRMILENVNYLMRERGYIGVKDMQGRLHYVVDGRDNIYSAVHKIIKEVDEDTGPEISDTMILLAVEGLFSKYKISCDLTGGRILRSMLMRCSRDPGLLTGVSKSLYHLMGREFSLSVDRIERDVRYAIKKSDLPDRFRSNAVALRYLSEQIYTWIVRQKDKKDKSKSLIRERGGNATK